MQPCFLLQWMGLITGAWNCAKERMTPGFLFFENSTYTLRIYMRRSRSSSLSEEKVSSTEKRHQLKSVIHLKLLFIHESYWIWSRSEIVSQPRSILICTSQWDSVYPSLCWSVWAEGHSDLSVGEQSQSVGLLNCSSRFALSASSLCCVHFTPEKWIFVSRYDEAPQYATRLVSYSLCMWCD